ncbi:DNA replication and checkpoint protein [Aspergillus parasiticus SU-1]|uniref:DNA replication regulator SLD2 n=1 Tax=Aspergillus parasiticus (strain ATCC 56775 / NRRL 5862 / SRRC 143 / SU-1) TaxID=1403190 RepID=A0A0F0I7T2_ASPPU|nr:DNA replication and checkpoint protein [Aspergillus parasiticus SU-1]
MLRSLLSLGSRNADYIFPTVDPKQDGPNCKLDCADCTVHFPSKVKVENSRVLYGHIKEFHTHVLVATGKSDWTERVENEKGSLMEAFDSSSNKSKHGRIMVSASNLSDPNHDPDDDHQTTQGTTVLLLPSFTFIDSVTTADVREVVDCFIDAPKGQPVDSRLPSRPCQYDYVVLLCSHRRRDARCGITAPLIKKELERHLRPHGLYRDADDERAGGVGIFFVSHVGGHKFAANVLIYRKQAEQMIWLARVKPEHSAKYKEYSRLKSLEKSVRYEKKHNPNSVDLQERPKKRKHASPPGSHEARLESTPRKAAKGPFTTPSKPRGHPSEFDPYDSPSALRRLFSPSTHQQSSSPLKTAIGPTPQRDGKALGLFDLLSESGGSTATPTAARLASVRGAAAQTPSKRKTLDTIAEEEEEEEDSPRGDRTPASASKSYMLSALFATPTTWRYATMMDNRNNAIRREPSPQPSANDAGQGAPESETPAFLRRSNSARYAASNPNGEGLSPINVRKRPQFVGKVLSALVQGLRDMEEEHLDNELDVLREIEAEQAGMNTEATDSQTVEQDTGPTFKKKGQKRTTRRVRMKPVISKPKRESQLPASEDEGGTDNVDQSDDELAAVPETQQPGTSRDETNGVPDAASLHSISEPELDSDSDYEEQSKPPARSKSFSERIRDAIGVVEPPPAEKREKPQPQVKERQTKPRERKVNPEAHANYRSLKLRNKNSKGRGAGRFGRRR